MGKSTASKTAAAKDQPRIVLQHGDCSAFTQTGGRPIDYYFRMRTYIPEWGMFTGPDMRIDVMEENGACTYLFANNNPLVYVDPVWSKNSSRPVRVKNFQHSQ